VHTSVECKTDILTVLTVTSGPDSHMMSKLDSHDTWRWNLLRLLPRALAEWLFRVWQDCYLVYLIGVNPRITINVRIVNQKMLNTTYTN